MAPLDVIWKVGLRKGEMGAMLTQPENIRKDSRQIRESGLGIETPPSHKKERVRIQLGIPGKLRFN